jgi:hypothetical protein
MASSGSARQRALDLDAQASAIEKDIRDALEQLGPIGMAEPLVDGALSIMRERCVVGCEHERMQSCLSCIPKRFLEHEAGSRHPALAIEPTSVTRDPYSLERRSEYY